MSYMMGKIHNIRDKKGKIFAFIVLFFSVVNLLSVKAGNIADSSSVREFPLNEVVVTGTRDSTDVRYLPLTVTTIDRAQIENRYEPSLLPILGEQVPGLFITSRGVMGYGVATGAAGEMKIRGIGGSPTTDLLVLIDGHPQYAGLMGHSLADVYQSLLAEKVEVVRGPASVLYGSNAMGGVINIITRQQQEGWQNRFRMGIGSYGTWTNEYSGSMRSSRFSGIFAGSYDRTDGHRSNMNYDQYTGFLKLGYELSQKWRLTGEADFTHFNASNPGPVNSLLMDNDSHIGRGTASVSLENDYGFSSGAVAFFYNWGRHNIDDGYPIGGTPPDYRFHSKDEMSGLNWYQTAKLFEGNHTTFGIDYQHIGGNAWNLYTNGNRTELADKQADEGAAYVDLRQELFSVLTFDGGLRVDHRSHMGTAWIPQAGLSLQLPRESELKAIVSKGFRNPTLREMFMFPPQNPDLQAESMMNYEISYRQHLSVTHLIYGINLFYIDGKNMIETVFVNGGPLNMNSGKIKNWGIETDLAYRLNTALNLSANYSFLSMKNPVTAAPKHKLYVGGDYSRNKWSLSTGWQWIGGLYTSISPVEKENFVLWNLRSSYALNRMIRFFIDGENLLSQKYEINAGFPMPRTTVMGGIDLKF